MTGTEIKREVVTKEGGEQKEMRSLLTLWRKLFLISIGAIVVAQRELESLVKTLVEKGELAEKEGRELVEKTMTGQKKKIRQAQQESEKYLEKALAKLNIPTKRDIEALESKIAKLTKKIDELGKS